MRKSRDGAKFEAISSRVPTASFARPITSIPTSRRRPRRTARCTVIPPPGSPGGDPNISAEVTDLERLFALLA